MFFNLYTPVYDSCIFCNRRFLLEFTFFINIGDLAANSRLINSE